MSFPTIQHSADNSSSVLQLPKEKILLTRGVKSINSVKAGSRPSYAIIAFTIGGVAGIVMVALGARHLFGSVRSCGFIGSIAGGGGIALLSFGGILYLVIAHRNAISKKREPMRRQTPEFVREINSPRVKRAAIALGEEAISFARQQLKEKNIFPAEIGLSKQEEEIDRLDQLYQRLTEAFEETLEKQYPDGVDSYKVPWDQKEFKDATDRLIKVGFVCSYLKLKAARSKEITVAHFWQIQTIYKCAVVGVEFEKVNQRYKAKFSEDRNRNHLFLQEGNIEFTWRMLYNHYVEQLNAYSKINHLSLPIDTPKLHTSFYSD